MLFRSASADRMIEEIRRAMADGDVLEAGLKRQREAAFAEPVESCRSF